jgi:tRNA pseudouridine13 synthase
MDDKDARMKAHQAIRRIFKSNLETITNGEDNSITVAATTPRTKNNAGNWSRTAGEGRSHGKLGWQELGGEYLHFTLYKENKDTMEVCYYLASQLKQSMKNFQFAGTKDRRAATAQRLSAFRVRADRMAALNKYLRNATIGDFKYEPRPLALGDLSGNEFRITLRDCHFPREEGLSTQEKLELGNRILSETVASFSKNGFINYFGLQRFGSFATSTDAVGKKMLQGNLKGAIDLILDFSPEILAIAQSQSDDTKVSSDDRNRALALHAFREGRPNYEVLDLLPRRFSGETAIIKHLGANKNGVRVNARDYQGAMLSLQRNLRLMYVHAYQSLVWNVVASKRIELYGSQIVEGDLVIIEDRSAPGTGLNYDEAGDEILQPADHDRAQGSRDYTQARPLTKAEAESGRYNVFDVMLPLPGYDVVYPSNEIGKYYETFMGSEEGGGLDPHDMRRKFKDASLSGDYRKLLARPIGDVKYEVRAYQTVDEQMVQTDLDRLRTAEKTAVEEAPNEMAVDCEEEQQRDEMKQEPDKVAVILRLALGSSTYATMALRELMKEGGVKSYKADFGMGR